MHTRTEISLIERSMQRCMAGFTRTAWVIFTGSLFSRWLQRWLDLLLYWVEETAIITAIHITFNHLPSWCIF